MKDPNWTDPQFVDANGTGGLNFAFGTVSGSITSVVSGAWASTGLLAPEAMTLAYSGMTVTAALPSPWGIVSASGAIVRAHGTMTGQNTNLYPVDFTSLVPASGSLTAYAAASVIQIQQDPFSIPGPPQGHPNFNPNYVPTIGYATNVLSVSVTAVTGGIDNISTFELFRTTLTAGQIAVSGVSAAGQVRASDRQARPALVLTSGGVLSPWQAQFTLIPGLPGLTHTLPDVASTAGLTFPFVNATTGGWTIVTSGTALIRGFSASGSPNLAVPSEGAGALWSNGAQWWLTEANPTLQASLTGGSQVAGGYGYPVPVGWLGLFGNGAYQDFGLPGTYTFIAPITGPYRFRLLGAGGGGSAVLGGNGAGGGGGGGGYTQAIVNLTAGTAVTGIVVGASGVGAVSGVAGNGGNSSIVGLGLLANGGTGASGQTGAAGGAGASTNTGTELNLTGGSGGTSPITGTPGGSGGGGAASQIGNGGNGGNSDSGSPFTSGGGGGTANNPGKNGSASDGGGGSAFGPGTATGGGPNMVGAVGAPTTNTLNVVTRFALDGFWGGGGAAGGNAGGTGAGGGGGGASGGNGGTCGGGGGGNSGNGGNGGIGGGGGGGSNGETGGNGGAGSVVVEW